MTLPTERTLRELRKHGWEAGVVERYNHHIRQKFDLYGGIDLLAMQCDDLIGIQATSGNGGNVAARVQKLQAENRMRLWLMGRDRRLQVWGWKAYKVKRGGKAVRWTPRIIELSLSKTGEILAEEYENYLEALEIRIDCN